MRREIYSTDPKTRGSNTQLIVDVDEEDGEITLAIEDDDSCSEIRLSPAELAAMLGSIEAVRER